MSNEPELKYRLILYIAIPGGQRVREEVVEATQLSELEPHFLTKWGVEYEIYGDEEGERIEVRADLVIMRRVMELPDLSHLDAPIEPDREPRQATTPFPQETGG